MSIKSDKLEGQKSSGGNVASSGFYERRWGYSA